MGTVLECTNLRKHYGKFTALNGINLSLPEGKIIGLLGPNGSGKTTLIKLASGLLVPTAGEIKVGGFAPGVDSNKIISYLPERNYLNDYMTVNQLISFFSDFYSDFDKNKAIDMLARLNIDSARRLK
ncbi:MAG: ATP-binding cassette domain-containing protein, partial [Oscillospiraceae bacterium]